MSIHRSSLPVFLSIAKTATTTLGELLERNYGADRVLVAPMRETDDGRGSALTVFSTHPQVRDVLASVQRRQWELGAIAVMLPYGIHRVLERPCSYFTLLRDPVERCRSAWHFVHRLRGTGHPMLPRFDAYRWNLRAILDDRAIWQFHNHQVRSVVGTRRFSIGPDDLAEAKHRIEHDFDVVGTQERLVETIAALADRYGWTATEPQRLNAAPGKPADVLPDDAARLFEEHNRWDVELVKWVNEVHLPRRAAADSHRLDVSA